MCFSSSIREESGRQEKWLLERVEESPLERVSASLDDPLKLEAPMSSLLKLLSACEHSDSMLASIHVGR